MTISLPKILRPFALVAGLGAAIGLSAPITASAQDDPGAGAEQARRGHGRRGRRGRRGHRGHMLRRLAGELELTDDQRAQMRTIHQETREQMRALRESGDRSAMRQLRRSVHDRIQSVLTDAQRAELAELRAQHARRRLSRRVERMTERLELSPTQAEQIRGILRHSASQRRALREQARLDESSPREAMRALRESTRAQIRSVLTEAQATQLDEMRANRGRRGRGHGFGRGHGRGRPAQ